MKVTWHPEQIIKYDDLNFGDGGPTRADLPPGTARWYEDANGRRLEYICPCGCQGVGSLPVDLGQHLDRRWQWDGNIESPTLSPSILRYSTCKWHGYLIAGEWKNA